MANSTVLTTSGEEIPKKDSITIGGKIYSKVKNDPPEVVQLYSNKEWVVFDPKVHVMPYKKNYYVHKHECRCAVVFGLKEDGSLLVTYYLNRDYLYDDISKFCKTRDTMKAYNNRAFWAYVRDTEAIEIFGVPEVMAFNGKDLETVGLNLHKLDGIYRYMTPTQLSKVEKTISSGDYIEPIKKVGYLPKIKNLRKQIKYGIKTPSYLISEKLNYTFGVELETSSGKIFPFEYPDNELNITCEHDGSIAGGEYVTGVLKGDAGFKQLYKICSFLSNRCKVDRTCGVHVHIGGVVFNKSFVVLSYLLGRKIENDIFSILPPSRRGNRYCGDLLDLGIQSIFDEYGYEYGIQIAYEKLYEALSNGKKLGKSFNKLKGHPQGRYCGQYHDVPFQKILRYKWLNLVPCTFNQRNWSPSKQQMSTPQTNTPLTIEFRNHSATLNYTKIKNWVLICMAFVNYVERHGKDIVSKDKITLDDIINSAYDRNAGPLLEYINRRADKFSVGLDAKGELEDIVENISYNDQIKMKDFICV